MISINIQSQEEESSSNFELYVVRKKQNIMNPLRNIIDQQNGQLFMIGRKTQKFSFETQVCTGNTMLFFCSLQVNETEIFTETSINNHHIISRINKYGITKFFHFLNRWNMKNNCGSKIVWKSKSSLISIIYLIPIYLKDFEEKFKNSLQRVWKELKQFLENFISTTNDLIQESYQKKQRPKNLQILKMIFQENRKQRKKSSSVSFSKNIEKGNDRSLNQQQRDFYQKSCQFIRDINQKYKDINPILNYIVIKQKSQFSLWGVNSGRSSSVKSYFFCFENIILRSMNKDTSQLLALQEEKAYNSAFNHCQQLSDQGDQDQQNKNNRIKIINSQKNNLKPKYVEKDSTSNDEDDDVKIFRTVLVQKTFLYDNDHFQNQLFIINLLRNDRCPFIASYYHSNPEQIEFLKAQSLYIHYYQKQLKEQYNNNNQRSIFFKLIQGIYYLWAKKLCHRDLNPTKVMLDQSYNPRIIGFGSASPCSGSMHGNKSKLRTTIKYNKQYRNCNPEIQKLYTQEQYQRHPLFDIYAFGVIMKEIFANTGFQRQLGKQMYENYSYIANKCLEENLEDRPTPQQIIIYFNQIQKMSKNFSYF